MAVGVVLDSGASAGPVGSGTMEPSGLKVGDVPGERVGASEIGPGAGTGAPTEALHWRGTPGMLQARGREIARVLLIGKRNGTLPVTMRHKQSMPLDVSVLSELQQSAVGEVPLALLLVSKFIQGVKMLSADGVHGVLIVLCP